MAALDRIRAHPAARDAALELVRGLENPVLRLEVVRVAKAVGWLDSEESLRVERDVVKRLLEPPTYGEGRDVVCGMESETLERIDLRAEELPPDVYDDEFAIQALGCLKPRDPKIHAALASVLSDSREWIARASAATLKAIAPSDPEVLAAIRARHPSFVSDRR
jgi:hypothetical protein